MKRVFPSENKYAQRCVGEAAAATHGANFSSTASSFGSKVCDCLKTPHHPLTRRLSCRSSASSVMTTSLIVSHHRRHLLSGSYISGALLESEFGFLRESRSSFTETKGLAWERERSLVFYTASTISSSIPSQPYRAPQDSAETSLVSFESIG
jgi:hypothetical protein